MSYQKYTTPAFVVSVAPVKEADKMVFLYTKDFGMVVAVAKSVRTMKSKLKYALESGHLILVSLVRGKEVWRLTDATVEGRIFLGEKLKVFLKTMKLLKSLVHGEEKNEKLFSYLLESLNVLSKKDFTEEHLESMECLSALRILDALGYGTAQEGLGVSISKPVDFSLLENLGSNKEKVISLINRSLAESHL